MVINKKVKYRKFVFYRLIFSLRFVRIVFIASSYDLTFASIILSHVITESPIIFDKYLSFLQLHVMGFQIYLFLHLCYVFYTHIDISRYPTFGLNYIFYHQVYIYVSMINDFLNIFDSFIPAIMLDHLI